MSRRLLLDMVERKYVASRDETEVLEKIKCAQNSSTWPHKVYLSQAVCL
jgi:hypothetical protein